MTGTDSDRRDRGQVGQRLLIQSLHQDRLDGVVAIFRDDTGAGTGGVEARRAVALRQAQDALGPAEPIERAVAQQAVDELRTGGADARRLLAAPGGCVHEEVDLLRWQM